MTVRSFTAATARDALRKVKDHLGADAVILSNHAVAGGVEIKAMAGRDMDHLVTHGTPRQAAPARPTPAPVQASTAPRQPAMPPRQDAWPEPRQVLPQAHQAASLAPLMLKQPAEEAFTPTQVMGELRALRQMVEDQLAGFAWRDMSRETPAKTGMLRQLLGAGFSPSLSRTLLAHLPKQVEAGAQALTWAQDTIAQQLTTHVQETEILNRGGVYALVGPTGVGKTTTTAKLAARCVLRFGASRVALISTDGYRIGAHEQLRIYGRILGVPVYTAKDAAELQQILAQLQNKHMVLIDNMGMSQRDRNIGAQTDMLEGCSVRRLLVMAATSRGDTLDEVVQAYGKQGLAGCILSKIDESAALATALDALVRHRLPLCYVTNGQRVPEDLHLPNKPYLLHKAFKTAATAAHQLDLQDAALRMTEAAAYA